MTSYDWPADGTSGGSGTVTSVALTVPAFLSIGGSPITTSGTLAITLSGVALPILNGGTGQTTANAAFNALAPSQTAQSGKFLKTDGTNTSWAAGSGGGVSSLNSLTGDLILAAGSNISITPSGGDTLTIAATGGSAPTGDANTLAYFDASGNLSDNVNAIFDESHNSLALGVIANNSSVLASGDGSLAFGVAVLLNTPGVESSGGGALSHGISNGIIRASGNGSHSHGYTADSSGFIHASADGSSAAGHATNGTILSGSYGSSARGSVNGFAITASGIASTAVGTTDTGDIIASGSVSRACGDNLNVSADFATGIGIGQVVSSYAAFVIGQYGVSTGTAGSWISTDPLFVVGNGSGIGSENNAFEIKKDGTLFIKDPSLSGSSVGNVWTLQDTATGEGAWAAGGGTPSDFIFTNTQPFAWWGSPDLPALVGNSDVINASISGVLAVVFGSSDTASAIVQSTGAAIMTGSHTNAASTLKTGEADFITGDNAGSGGTGPMGFVTGTATGAGDSGGYNFQTGDAAAGDSGGYTIYTGTASGSRGKIRFVEGSEGTAGYVWTSTDTVGTGAWVANSGGGASTSLNNLASTAINADLIFDTGTFAKVKTKDNGAGNTETLYLTTGTSTAISGALRANTGDTNSAVDNDQSGTVYISSGASTVNQATAGGVGSGQVSISTGSTKNTQSGPVQVVSGASEYQSGDLFLLTGDGLIADDAWSGDIFVHTGNVTGTAQSGSVSITPGTVGTGTRGQIKFVDGTEGTAGHVWTSTGTAGEGSWAASAVAPGISLAAKGTGTIPTLTASLTVTDATVTTSSLVFVVLKSAGTAVLANVVPGTGTFVINLSVSVTGGTDFGYMVVN